MILFVRKEFFFIDSLLFMFFYLTPTLDYVGVIAIIFLLFDFVGLHKLRPATVWRHVFSTNFFLLSLFLAEL